MTGRRVIVNNGNVEQALRKFKKKIMEMGLIQEVRDRGHYVKPTTERKVKKGQAKSRWNKHLRSQTLPKKLY